MINRDRLVGTFIDLVTIDSPSHHEDEIAEDLDQTPQRAEARRTD